MNLGKINLAKSLVAAIFLAAIILSIFAGSLASDSDKDDARDAAGLYWPAPPDTARIKFISAISSPKDLKLKKSSFFKRVVKKIVGIEDSDSSIISPYGVTTDSRNRIIVADQQSHLIHVFDPEEKKYFSIKAPKHDPFFSLVGLALDAEDNIYLSDSISGKILIFDRNGKFKKRLGPDEGLFNRPTGIAIDKESRRLYVVETVKGEVDVLTLDGTELFKFGKRGYGKGEFNRPTQICVRGNKVFVTDTLNARIQIFDTDGKFISAIGHLGDGLGDLDKPKGVAVDSEGHIYVVEGLHDVVQIFDQAGTLLLAFGGTGSRKGEFYLPTAIHIDRDDNIYVSDSFNHRVQVFKYLKDSDSPGK